MKKLFPLLILVILVVSPPLVRADPDIETLWCDSYATNRLGWTHAGATPYLGDTDGSYIYTKLADQTEGDFGFSDLPLAGTITSVTLYVECKADDAPADDGFNVFVFDGSSWTQEGGTIQPPQTDYQYVQLSLTTKLDTSDKVNAAQVYFHLIKVGGADEVYIRRAYLYIDYTPTQQGQEYSRYPTQSLSWSGVGTKTWDASRDFTQGVTISSDSSRTWTLTRAFTQSITFSSSAFEDLMEYVLIQVSQSIAFTSDSLRTWSLSRTFTQGFTFASSVERFAQFLRNPVQSITIAVEAFRSWTLTRTFSLPMTLSSNAIVDIFKSFQRTLTLGIKLSSDAFREWSLSRAFTQGLSLTSLTDRNWSLIRIATQSLTASIESNRIVSAIRQLSQNIAISSNAGRIGTFLRGLSQSITISSETFRSWSLSRSFTQGISLASSIWTHLTVGAEQFLRTLTLSMSLSTESTRNWNLARTLTQGISFSSLSDRGWSLIRLATQSITANIESNRIFSAIRQVSQNIALSSSAGRIGTFLRGITQAITISSETLRSWSLTRSFSQGLSFLSNIVIKLTEYIPDPPDPEEFFRAVSIGMQLASNNIRNWSLTRTFSQGIAFSSNIWAKLYTDVIRRVATLYLNLASNIDLSMRIVNEFNFPQILMGAIALLFSTMYFLYDKKYQVGIIAFGAWFIMFATTMYYSPDAWGEAVFFAGMAMVHIIFLMMDYAGAKKVDFWN